MATKYCYNHRCDYEKNYQLYVLIDFALSDSFELQPDLFLIGSLSLINLRQFWIWKGSLGFGAEEVNSAFGWACICSDIKTEC